MRLGLHGGAYESMETRLRPEAVRPFEHAVQMGHIYLLELLESTNGVMSGDGRRKKLERSKLGIKLGLKWQMHAHSARLL